MDISIRFCSQGLQGFFEEFQKSRIWWTATLLRERRGPSGGQLKSWLKGEFYRKMEWSQGITRRRLTRYLWQVLLPTDHRVRSKVLEPPLRLQFNPCSSKWSGSQGSPPLQSTFVFCINLSWCSRQLVQLFSFLPDPSSPVSETRGRGYGCGWGGDTDLIVP